MVEVDSLRKLVLKLEPVELPSEAQEEWSDNVWFRTSARLVRRPTIFPATLPVELVIRVDSIGDVVVGVLPDWLSEVFPLGGLSRYGIFCEERCNVECVVRPVDGWCKAEACIYFKRDHPELSEDWTEFQGEFYGTILRSYSFEELEVMAAACMPRLQNALSSDPEVRDSAIVYLERALWTEGIFEGISCRDAMEPIKRLKREGRLEEALRLARVAMEGSVHRAAAEAPLIRHVNRVYVHQAEVILRKLERSGEAATVRAEFEARVAKLE